MAEDAAEARPDDYPSDRPDDATPDHPHTAADPDPAPASAQPADEPAEPTTRAATTPPRDDKQSAVAEAAALAAAARANPDRGAKRTRDEADVPAAAADPHTTSVAPAIYAPPSLYPQVEPHDGGASALQQMYDADAPSKKSRQNCYKCGGDGHIAVMCPSRPGANEDPGAMQCHSCNGRGHLARECPSALMKDQCFRCGQLGHRGRECPTMYGYNAGAQVASTGYAAYGNGATTGYAAATGYADPYAMQYGVGAGYGRGAYGMGRAGMRAVPGTGKCFRCNNEGHWTRDCPLKPPDSDPNGCYKCGRPGHRARDCNVCYKCMQPGHRAADCPSVV